MDSQVHIDQMGFSINLPQNPQRIISLVPSQTELLHYLHLTDRVVGITKFCIHPEKWRTEKTIVGGTKKFHSDKIDSLQPDLIIGNKEENYPEGILHLKERYPVWMSDVNTFSDALQMIRGIGEITNREKPANQLVEDIQSRFDEFKKPEGSASVLYFIWKDPWMVVGANTFINDVLSKIGFTNCAAGLSRYPVLEDVTLSQLDPDLIFLSDEPFPFTKEHVKIFEALFPRAKVILVDGTYFSWYGSRLMDALGYFKRLIKEIAS